MRSLFSRDVPAPAGAPIPGPAWYALVAGALALVVFAWLSIGHDFLGARVPAMDSVAYQEEAFDVLWAGRQEGYAEGWRASFVARYAAQNALHRIALAALAPVLPLSRSSLYAYLFGVQLLALFALATFLYRRTRSPLLGLLGPAAYLTAAPFGTLAMTPIVDQALDLTSAAFVVLAFLAAWRWMERPTFARAAVTGLALGAAVLHRSICGPQLATMMLAFAALGLIDARVRRARLMGQIALAAFVAIALAAPWYWPARESIARYYGAYSYAVGKPLTLGETVSETLEFLDRIGWAQAAIGVVLLAVTAAFARSLRLRGLAMIGVAFVSPLVPLVVTRSSVIEPVYPTLGALALAPLLVRDARELRSLSPIAALVPALLLAWSCWSAGRNVERLARQVDRMGPEPRVAAVRLIHQITTAVRARPLRLSGFVTEGVGAIGLASLIRIEHHQWAVGGLQPIVEHDFFVPVGQPCDGERCWEEVPALAVRDGVACALERMVGRSRALLVVDHEHLHELRYEQVFFAHVHMREIVDAVRADPRFEDRGITGVVNGTPVRVYTIAEGARPRYEVCCSARLTPNHACAHGSDSHTSSISAQSE